MLTLVLAAALVQTPAFLAPLEEVFEAISVGPSAGGHVLVDRHGVAPAFAAGFTLVWFDLEKVYEPRCVQHRQSEREQLGATEGGVLDGALSTAQQECRAIDEKVHLAFAAGLELEVALRAQRELALRGWGTLLKLYRTLGLGMSTSLVFADRPGGTATGFRLGAELSWSQRLGTKGFRPVLQPFVRGELVLLGRDTITDQAAAGLRFVFDI